MDYKGDLGQLGEIRDKLKKEFEKLKPDLVIVFGDVTSTLAAALSSKMLNIELAHVESGLRSRDIKMPEEVNRILTDHITKYYFVTDQSGVDNLRGEGITDNVYLVGNTMIDTQKKYLQQALDTKYYEKLGVKSKHYVLITLHRPSNVDNMDKLKEIFDDFEKLSKTVTLVYPIHPRTKNNLEKLGYLQKVKENPNIILDEPLGYLEFTCLMANCKYVVTDSGGLQEESTALDIPCFTLRENTERPCTLIENHGTNQLIHKISEIDLKECKGTMDLWDGKSGERIKDIATTFFFLNNLIITNKDTQTYEDILKNGIKIRRDLPYIKLNLPIDYYKPLYKNDKNYIYSLHSWKHVIPYIFYYDKTRSKDILDTILNELYNWFNYNLDNNKPNIFNVVIWMDMTVGIRSQILSYLYLIDSNNKKINKLIKLHKEFLLSKENWRNHNHCLWMCMGLITLCKVTNESKENIDFCNDQFNKILDSQYFDYIHTENSPEYHVYIYKQILKIYHSKLFSDKIGNMLDIIYYNTFWLLRGNNYFVPFGDTSPKKFHDLNPNIYDTNVNSKVPHQCKGHTYNNYLYKIFDKTGYISIRSIDKQDSFLMDIGCVSKNHKHPDNLTFEWFSQNTPILINPGKYAYGSSKERNYILSTQAHNCLQIDNLNYPCSISKLFKPYKVDYSF